MQDARQGSSHDSPEAVIEWTHWKSRSGTALRGDEWYQFDADAGRRACRAFGVPVHFAGMAPDGGTVGSSA